MSRSVPVFTPGSELGAGVVSQLARIHVAEARIENIRYVRATSVHSSCIALGGPPCWVVLDRLLRTHAHSQPC
jgi:hypothetical protein